MSTDELEELIRKLLTHGVTVVLLALGPTGQLTTTPDATPSPDGATTGIGTPDTRRRPPLEITPDRDGTDGTGEVGGGDSGDRDDDRQEADSGSGGTGDSDTGDSDTGDSDTGDSDTDDSDTGDSDTDDSDTGDSDTDDSDTGDSDTDDSDTGTSDPGTSDDGGETGGADRGGGTGAAPSGDDASDTADTTGNGTTGDAEVSATGTTAAETFDWGEPVRADDFTGGTSGWSIYDGPGHAGNGRRTPDAVSVADGVLTITGDAEGNTAGMAWTEGSQKYGRWEGRVRAPESDPSYNALLLLWPTAENFPEGGEVDFMEMMDPSRQETSMFLHYGADNSQIDGSVRVDATQWHHWAVEWTPERIAAFVDGEQWFETTDTSILPPGPMHLCIQLDWFPKGGSVRESRMEVDWVRQYAVDGG